MKIEINNNSEMTTTLPKGEMEKNAKASSYHQLFVLPCPFHL